MGDDLSVDTQALKTALSAIQNIDIHGLRWSAPVCGGVDRATSVARLCSRANKNTLLEVDDVHKIPGVGRISRFMPKRPHLGGDAFASDPKDCDLDIRNLSVGGISCGWHRFAFPCSTPSETSTCPLLPFHELRVGKVIGFPSPGWQSRLLNKLWRLVADSVGVRLTLFFRCDTIPCHPSQNPPFVSSRGRNIYDAPGLTQCGNSSPKSHIMIAAGNFGNHFIETLEFSVAHLGYFGMITVIP